MRKDAAAILTDIVTTAYQYYLQNQHRIPPDPSNIPLGRSSIIDMQAGFRIATSLMLRDPERIGLLAARLDQEFVASQSLIDELLQALEGPLLQIDSMIGRNEKETV